MLCLRSLVWIRTSCTSIILLFSRTKRYVPVWTRFVLVHTRLYQLCLGTYWSGIVLSTFQLIQLHAWFVLVHTKFVLRHTFIVKAWKGMYWVVIGTIQFHILPYHAMVWYHYKLSISCLSQYLPPCTTGWDTSEFEMLRIDSVLTSPYNKLHCISWAFLWKAEFARIPTSAR